MDWRDERWHFGDKLQKEEQLAKIGVIKQMVSALVAI